MTRRWRRPPGRSTVRYALLTFALGAATVAGLVVTRDDRPSGPVRALGARLFQKEFTPDDGLGPLFNEQSCSSCHADPVLGGMGPDGLSTVLRVGRLTGRGFSATFGRGQDARRIEAHAHSISELGAECDRAAGIPAGANVTSVRNAPPLFGTGLIDAIPDEVIRVNARRQRGGVSGRPNLVPGPDGGDDVGRFGWKGDTPTLEQFVAEAFRSELGVTSALAPAGPLPAGIERCTGESSEPELDREEVRAVTDFVAGLPAPRPRPDRTGDALFLETGCATCHVPALEGASGPVPLYSDLLLHDMGPELDDGVVQGTAGGSEWRTTPLWGLSDRERFLHDGRADSVEAAILAHGGEAAGARRRFKGLPADDLRALLDYLRGL